MGVVEWDPFILPTFRVPAEAKRRLGKRWFSCKHAQLSGRMQNICGSMLALRTARPACTSESVRSTALPPPTMARKRSRKTCFQAPSSPLGTLVLARRSGACNHNSVGGSTSLHAMQEAANPNFAKLGSWLIIMYPDANPPSTEPGQGLLPHVSYQTCALNMKSLHD